ncbi:hypothetical protein LMZ02_13855 [Paenibacillus macerans]|uniref:hypothetical protein n=1 Tax=Paenibacillus macerans TaxID=44252 RepID=UPI00055A225D|nr:hypothetical protein [Paenibacillus macerans]MBS5913093.1 hypothetical protein [Paenibacillus macerans]MEC0328524.1 hypothetical protein [Paenibacillus macerans]UMV50360.1 hypothetical protein LMZ02_13855 [Paenibacillus macerans]
MGEKWGPAAEIETKNVVIAAKSGRITKIRTKNSAIVYPIEYRQASGRYSSGNSTEYLADDPLSIGERSTGSQLLINLRKHQNQAADLFSGLIAILR